MRSVNYSIDFVKHRKLFFGFSIGLTVVGIITLLIFGLNYGVDFKAGTNVDIALQQSITKEKAEQLIVNAGFESDSFVLTVGGNSDRVTARFDKILSANGEEITRLLNGFEAEFGNNITHEENTVSPDMAKELAVKAIIAVLLASLGIIVYVSIRFEWRFAVGAIISLFYDAFIVITFFSILRLEVNLTFVAAVLTIIGYSINDTIVIFDRIRENLPITKIKTFADLSDMVNHSIWQTLTRSINTVLTVVFAAACLYIFGSESIKLFSLAMIVGLISGAYSSIFIASQVWAVLKYKSMQQPKKAALAKE